jgi:cobalamin biosynthesis Mg chelatase CobN
MNEKTEKIAERLEVLSAKERDRRVLLLYEQVSEIEQRLIPTGLHVFGRAPEKNARADMLRMVASFDRPESNTRALPEMVAEGAGFGSYTKLLETSRGDERQLRVKESFSSTRMRKPLASGWQRLPM